MEKPLLMETLGWWQHEKSQAHLLVANVPAMLATESLGELLAANIRLRFPLHGHCRLQLAAVWRHIGLGLP